MCSGRTVYNITEALLLHLRSLSAPNFYKHLSKRLPVLRQVAVRKKIDSPVLCELTVRKKYNPYTVVHRCCMPSTLSTWVVKITFPAFRIPSNRYSIRSMTGMNTHCLLVKT